MQMPVMHRRRNGDRTPKPPATFQQCALQHVRCISNRLGRADDDARRKKQKHNEKKELMFVVMMRCRYPMFTAPGTVNERKRKKHAMQCRHHERCVRMKKEE